MTNKICEKARPQCCGAGAGEKGSGSGLLLFGLGVLWWQKVATILVKFSHISTIYTQIERKNRHTLKKTKLLTLVFKTAFFT